MRTTFCAGPPKSEQTRSCNQDEARQGYHRVPRACSGEPDMCKIRDRQILREQDYYISVLDLVHCPCILYSPTDRQTDFFEYRTYKAAKLCVYFSSHIKKYCLLQLIVVNDSSSPTHSRRRQSSHKQYRLSSSLAA